MDESVKDKGLMLNLTFDDYKTKISIPVFGVYGELNNGPTKMPIS